MTEPSIKRFAHNWGPAHYQFFRFTLTFYVSSVVVRKPCGCGFDRIAVDDYDHPVRRGVRRSRAPLIEAASLQPEDPAGNGRGFFMTVYTRPHGAT